MKRKVLRRWRNVDSDWADVANFRCGDQRRWKPGYRQLRVWHFILFYNANVSLFSPKILTRFILCRQTVRLCVWERAPADEVFRRTAATAPPVCWSLPASCRWSQSASSCAQSWLASPHSTASRSCRSWRQYSAGHSASSPVTPRTHAPPDDTHTHTHTPVT